MSEIVEVCKDCYGYKDEICDGNNSKCKSYTNPLLITEKIEKFKAWQKETLGFIRYKFENKANYDGDGGRNWSIQIYLRTGQFSHTKPGDYDTEKKVLEFINLKMGAE